MPDVKLNGTLPSGDANGINTLVQKLIDHPGQLHAVIAILDCKSTVKDNDTGEITPTARIRRIEVVPYNDLNTAADMMTSAFEQRTGKAALPLELEAEIRAAFRQPGGLT